MMLALMLLAALSADQRKSGSEYMSDATRAMQREDAQNPAMLWVAEGEALWSQSCASCHGDAKTSMKGVAARFPAFDRQAGRVVNLAQRINHARGAAPYKLESKELLSLESYVALQSRGMPVAPPAGKQLDLARARGHALYVQRIGQLNLSCAQCHDANAGKRLAASPIPQGHANAYPVYRLEWQDMGSLQRRLRNCMSGVRAEAPALGAQELVDLEAYLAGRAKGMTIESPGVRP